MNSNNIQIIEEGIQNVDREIEEIKNISYINSNKYDELMMKMDMIEKLLNENKKNCDKMSNHIDFVEKVFEYVKSPFFYVMNKVKSLGYKETAPIEFYVEKY